MEKKLFLMDLLRDLWHPEDEKRSVIFFFKYLFCVTALFPRWSILFWMEGKKNVNCLKIVSLHFSAQLLVKYCDWSALFHGTCQKRPAGSRNAPKNFFHQAFARQNAVCLEWRLSWLAFYDPRAFSISGFPYFKIDGKNHLIFLGRQKSDDIFLRARERVKSQFSFNLQCWSCFLKQLQWLHFAEKNIEKKLRPILFSFRKLWTASKEEKLQL